MVGLKGVTTQTDTQRQRQKEGDDPTGDLRMATPQGGRRRGGGPGSEAHGGLCPLSSDVVQAWVTGSVGSWKLWAEHGPLDSCLGDGHTQSHPARMPQGQRGVSVLVRAAGLMGRGAALDSAVGHPPGPRGGRGGGQRLQWGEGASLSWTHTSPSGVHTQVLRTLKGQAEQTLRAQAGPSEPQTPGNRQPLPPQSTCPQTCKRPGASTHVTSRVAVEVK